ncbi:alanine racemase [bacterium]|nr:alanine racemase [bacterium]
MTVSSGANQAAGAEVPLQDLEIPCGRRSWVEIDVGALRRNAARFVARMPAGGRFIPAVKKNGYGHGVLTVMRVLKDFPEFAVAAVSEFDEALALRAEFDGPILCFAVLTGEALCEAVEAGIILTVTNLDEAAEADRAAAEVGRPAAAHFKLDTGMGRIGRLPDEALPQMPAILALERLRIEGLYTHLANGWADPEGARRQWTRLREFQHLAGLEAVPCHIGGSDALVLGTIASPNVWLRTGIVLYGDHPGVAGLEPVMTFKSHVVYRRSVPAGTTISYGMTFTTGRPTELAVIGAGYGNGYPRALSGRGEVLLGGVRRPILGRVCMDQFMVDVTDGPSVAVGDEAVLFGKQGQAILPAAELAEKAGTISYEMFCLAGQLNKRYEV